MIVGYQYKLLMFHPEKYITISVIHGLGFLCIEPTLAKSKNFGRRVRSRLWISTVGRCYRFNVFRSSCNGFG